MNHDAIEDDTMNDEPLNSDVLNDETLNDESIEDAAMNDETMSHEAIEDETASEGREIPDASDCGEYAEYFSEDAFWDKMKGIFKKAGRELLEAALKLYYATRDADTPVWVKAIAIGALGYLILPIDVIPDIIPFVGLSDDLAVLVAALSAVASHINNYHVVQAEEKLHDWFGS